MTLETLTITPEKLKRGGQLGNSNALIHGFYSVLNPSPYRESLKGARRLCSPRLGSPAYVSEYIFLTGLKFVKEINQTLALFAPQMLLASTGEELMQWLRPMIKLMRARHRLIRHMFLGSYHDRALFTLSHDPIKWVNLEFRDRDLREFPIIHPPDFDKFCADSSSTSYSFRNNTIIPSSVAEVFVWIYFKKSSQITRTPQENSIPSPFLTNQQWLLIADSLSCLLSEIISSRKYKRNKLGFPLRVLLEAILVKLAFNLPWKELPGFIKMIHPNLPSFPLRRCQSLYTDLYNSGFLQGMYKQLYLHFSRYAGTSLEMLVKQGCFHANNRSIFLAPSAPLTWQNFTALLLLQRGYHNYRTVNHANKA